MNNTQTNSNNLSSNQKSDIKYKDAVDDMFEKRTALSPMTSTSTTICISSSIERCPRVVDMDYEILPRYIGDGSINYNHKKAMEMALRRIIQLGMNK